MHRKQVKTKLNVRKGLPINILNIYNIKYEIKDIFTTEN